VYAAGHAHFCGNLGGRPETNPRTYDRAVAFSKATTGTLARNTEGNYFDFGGQPAPSPLLWYPDLDQGTFTGQNQGPWHVTGNAEYVVMGGEFRNVNFSPQQGLVRFAVPSIAPNRLGPRVFGSGWVPSAASSFNGTVRLTFPANHDLDNATLTYRIERDGRAVGSFTARSSWFDRPTLTYVDGSATPGSRPTYRIVAVDPFGNEAPSQPVSVSVSSSGTRPAYLDTVLTTNGLLDHWRLDQTSGTLADTAGTRPLTLSGSATRGVAGAIPNDPDRSVTFNGGSAVSNAARTSASFSVEAWVRTNTTTGGKIVGSENSGGSTVLDRHLYLGNDGRVYFGVNTGTNQSINSPSAINDNRWRHVVGTYDAGVMRLYVDGVEVASRTGVGTARIYNAVWRVGGGSLAGWTPRPSRDNLTGSIDEVSVYSVAIPASVVRQHWDAGRTGAAANQPPTASFTTTVTGSTVAVDGRGSTDADGTIASYAWNFGDGATGSGATASRTYATAGTYTVTLTVTDDRGAASTTTRNVTVTPVAPGQPFASDTFGRSVTNGLGVADVGGTWSITGTPSRFSVSGGQARFTMATPAASSFAVLPAASSNTDVQVSLSLDRLVANGSGFAALIGRRVGTADYRTKVRVLPDGQLQISLVRTAAGAETTLTTVAVPGVSLAAGERLQVRMTVAGTGTTTLRAKVWEAGTPEPAAWLATATDTTTGLQSAGGVGLWVYLSSAAANAPVTVSFDDLRAVAL
jgi:PKD repeat protein